MRGFLEYVPGSSLLHRMNPVTKLACSLLAIFACFLANSLVFLAAVLVVDYVLAARCKLLPQTLGLSKAVASFSLMLAIIALLTTPEGTPIVGLPWGYIGTGSLRAMALVVLRLLACAIPLFLTFYVTKVNDISNALVKVCHVPYRYAFVFTSTVRFIPVFMNDMEGIMEAQTARGVEFDGGLIKRLRLMAPLCVPLLVSSVRKTNSAAIAAEVRGFSLRTRASGHKRYPFAPLDAMAFAACVALLVAGIVL